MTLPDRRRLALAEWGDPQGKPIFVFIGGQGRATCHPDESIAQRAGLRLFTVDRPGNGASDWQPGRTLSSFAADIGYAADQLGCPRFGLIGVSQGGATAAACAAHLPDRITALALVSSLAPPEHFVSPSGRRFIWISRRAPFLLQVMHTLARVMVRYDAHRMMQQVINSLPEADRALFASDPALIDTLAHGLREDYRQGARGVVRDAQLAYLPWELQPDTLTTPTLIWQGEMDTTVIPDAARWWASQLPDSRLTLIPTAGHMLAFTHWEAILTQLAEMLP